MLSTLALATAALFCPQGGPGNSSSIVVINEFQYDDASIDNLEFVELYNRSGKPVDISGWVLDSADAAGPNTSYTIPAGTTLGTAGYYTIGADAANPGKIDLVVGTTNLWENGNESLTLRDTNNTIIDTLIYESVSGIFDPNLAEGAGLRARHTSLDTKTLSWQRIRDGYDTDNNSRDFFLMLMTPGEANYKESNYPIEDTFDFGKDGDPVPGYTHSFSPLRYFDPLKVGPMMPNGQNLNPSAIPLSNHWGQCALLWDHTGGGTSIHYDNLAVENVTIRLDVWVEGTLAPSAGEGETWNIGVRGSVGRFAHHTDPGGTFPGSWLPGNTGIAVCYQRTDTYVKVWFVDYEDGSAPPTILATFDYTPGAPGTLSPGWQRLMVKAYKDTAYIFLEGQQLTTKIKSIEPGGIYMSYRENFNDNNLARPLTIDQWRVLDADAKVIHYGNATAHNFGTPTIGISSLPTINNSNFALTAANLRPNNTVLWAIGGRPETPFLDLAAFGGIPGSLCWVFIVDVQSTQSDAFGRASLQMPIPNDIGLSGANAAAQVLDLDFTYPAALPFGTSRGMLINIGQ